jgi:hypothetical protein
VDNLGKNIAYALARCGFGDQLLVIFGKRTRENIQPMLAHWRDAIHQELRTNTRGFLRHKHLSVNLPTDFPDIQVLENYANPLCSAHVGRQGGGPMRATGKINLAMIAGFCEH